MEKIKRGGGKYISNRFEYWSVADCACVHCTNYIRKGRSCALDTCCIEDIRQKALRRENAGLKGNVSFGSASLAQSV